MSTTEGNIRKQHPYLRFTHERAKVGNGKEVFRVIAYNGDRVVASADAGALRRAWQQVGKALKRRT